MKLWTTILIKALTYRLLCLILGIVIVWALTRSLVEAFKISLLYNAGVTLLFVAHEYLWSLRRTTPETPEQRSPKDGATSADSLER